MFSEFRGAEVPMDGRRRLEALLVETDDALETGLLRHPALSWKNDDNSGCSPGRIGRGMRGRNSRLTYRFGAGGATGTPELRHNAQGIVCVTLLASRTGQARQGHTAMPPQEPHNCAIMGGCNRGLQQAYRRPPNQ